MTRKEAIKDLMELRKYIQIPDGMTGCLDMAIKALEQEPILEKIRAEIKTKYDSIPWRNNDYDDGWVEALEWVFDDVIGKYKAESEENYSIKTVTNAEEAEEYQISEDISKGFEEFTKMMFKQGQKESEVSNADSD